MFTHRGLFARLLCLLLVPATHLPGQSLYRSFQQPPVEARPIGLWDWTNGNVSLSQITRELEEAKAKGMGGFDIWDVGAFVDVQKRVPAGPPFMSDESAQAIAHAVREADRLELRLGLVSSSSWNAGGTWVRPEHGTMGLYQSKTTVVGGQRYAGKLPFPDLPRDSAYRVKRALIEYAATGLPTFYQEVGVIAMPKGQTVLQPRLVFDLSERLQPDGTLQWDAPPGEWEVVRYVVAPSGEPLRAPSPNSIGRMIDHFNPAATEAHLVYILDKLQGLLGTLRNRSLQYLYTDSYEVRGGIWTPALAQAFQTRYGYSIRPFLPVFSGKVVNSPDVTARFLYDYQKLLSDLIIENHYRKGVEVCARYGLQYAAEAGGPGPPIHNVPYEDLKALGALSFPRGEFWNKHPKPDLHKVIKGISSAAHVYNQKYVEAESFTSVWVWQEGPQELKPLVDEAFCEGLNRVVYHTFPHTPPEAGSPGWVYNFGTLIHLNNTWWPKSAPFHAYLGRCSYLLQQGNFVGDVAFYYGDQAPNFVPAKKVHPSLGAGYDYDVVNSEAILTKMRVQNGKIVLPHGQTYEVLVLPDDERVNLKVLQKLAALVRVGATVVGRRPTRTYGLGYAEADERQIRALTAELWGDCDSVRVQSHRYGKGQIVWGKSLRQVLQARGVPPDFQAQADTSLGFDYIHRRTATAEIYFVRNTRKQAGMATLTFRTNRGTPQCWDPTTGQRFAFSQVQRGQQGTTVQLFVEPEASFFVVFGEDPIPTPLETQPGPLPTAQTLTGEWEVRFPHGWDAPRSIGFPTLTDWTQHADSTIRQFSGVAAYHTTFSWAKSAAKKRVYLDLGAVREIADVWLNGHHLGERCFVPYRYDVTAFLAEGNNHLTVEVANVLNNRMVGDAKRPLAYQRTYSNILRGPNPWMHPWAEVKLVSSGLLGPVRLLRE